jgi:DNA-binding response OmpR family regulator
VKKILIIDDSNSIRAELASFLSFENYEVIEAEDGLTGFELAKKHLPDLIISDVLLPEMDGFEEFAELRKNPETANIPFIFLTGMTSLSSHIRALGAEDFFTKPYYPELLLAKIKALLNEPGENPVKQEDN